ncbi:MAG: cbb3-type cytochrome oxidase assembly protein CcoS [Saprospiraceae bacterium]|nr:cbb3-type cytochrome oxidase assembly protein CcoS [Saprospiraceae bacterium]MCC7503938.1 cbb3-type cytochrome oxidase assembly protein CcoS [Saprospiraceae bacterium]
MAIIFFLILVSLIVASGFLMAYLWATRTGQFDDSYTPAVRMLFDDEIKNASKEDQSGEKNPDDVQTKTNLS